MAADLGSRHNEAPPPIYFESHRTPQGLTARVLHVDNTGVLAKADVDEALHLFARDNGRSVRRGTIDLDQLSPATFPNRLRILLTPISSVRLPTIPSMARHVPPRILRTKRLHLIASAHGLKRLWAQYAFPIVGVGGIVVSPARRDSK